MKFYDMKNKNLLFFKKGIKNDKIWDEKWEKDKYLSKSMEFRFNPDSFVCKITRTFLKPLDGPILEGGCGLGFQVYSLKKLNYNVVGIDNSKVAIKVVNKTRPELNVKYGDVQKMLFPDNHFAGYWSIGVIEHSFNGYMNIAKESYRVIKPEGFLFLVFPYMSPLRRFKAKFWLYKTIAYDANIRVEPKYFYQFALNKKQVIKDFKMTGYELISSFKLTGIRGFMAEVFLFQRFINTVLNFLIFQEKFSFLKKILEKIFAKFSSHIILLVFKKK